MTLGPDLDWLADSEGTLRPDAARAIAQPPGAVPPPALQRAAANAALRAVRPPLQPGIPRIVLAPAWVPVVIVGVAIAGVAVGRWSGSKSLPATSTEFSTNQQTAVTSPPPVRQAVVNGVNVNLRTGPGLFAPVLGRLVPGETVRLSGERSGWFVVETSSGLRGFVFGALLRGAGSVEGSSATITEPLRADVAGGTLDLRPGQRVLARSDGSGVTTILLPTGVRLGVPQHALAFLD